MPLLDQLLSYKTTAYSTRFQGGRRLSVRGIITPILCAAGVQLNKKKSTPAGWMDIKFCKTNTAVPDEEHITVQVSPSRELDPLGHGLRLFNPYQSRELC
ncbi:unnamed protein product [Microthlaspi erraticum]|uniref:Arabidopsis retrotransposon Orf1 C-terminal domain-containing protein n=1 Tax=Microthlaspi erraticum TaxID=1685480 RepID=A0A6D2HR11_9BRAS|nr:unnamed protein product [Microthlaspi erraticum]